MYQLRPYQAEAVKETLSHFRKSKSPSVIVLPTGAGKSIIIAELARLARGRVLVLAHVKELIEQNHAKYISFGLEAGIFSAGLQRKDFEQKVIFGSIQSIARAPEEFFNHFSILIIDECHRVSIEGETQYFQVIHKLQAANKELCILGLTATPYRLGLGWIYEYHNQRHLQQTTDERFFKKCIYEVSIKKMLEDNYLTNPIKIDSPVACYDFSSLITHGTSYVNSQIEAILKDQKRITPSIIKNIIDMSIDRQGVMIFTSSINHAVEIMKCLPAYISALIIGETDSSEREETIEAFKDKKLKFLVNVSVLTTGFDVPHVDVIAILRPTESVSLFQQIIGRGLRLSPGKKDCLILDYTGQGHDLFSPEIDSKKPHPTSVIVDILCPQCGTVNNFWGIKDSSGEVIEHFGRQCKGAFENDNDSEIQKCNFLFRFKRCNQCGEENDTSAHTCKSCSNILIDNDKILKEAMSLKDAHVMRVDTMLFKHSIDKNLGSRLEVQYYDVDAEVLKEFFSFNSPEDIKKFNYTFTRMHLRLPENKFEISNIEQAINCVNLFRAPMFIVARKVKTFWTIREKIFND